MCVSCTNREVRLKIVHQAATDKGTEEVTRRAYSYETQNADSIHSLSRVQPNPKRHPLHIGVNMDEDDGVRKSQHHRSGTGGMYRAGILLVPPSTSVSK